MKMRRCERRCEDEKMRYRSPLLEEPCAQTLSGIKEKTKDHRAEPFKWQAMASNASGRHRTVDHMLPLQPLDQKAGELGSSGRLRRC